jgi:hypothetical protein
MRIFSRTYDVLNPDKLHEQLSTLLGPKFIRVAFVPGEVVGTKEVTFEFTDDTTDAELLVARDTIINTHVPSQLTDAQTLRQWVKNLPVTYNTDPTTITNAQMQKAILALILWLKGQL